MLAIALLILGLLFIRYEIKEKISKYIRIININKKEIKHIEYYREKLDDYSPLIYAKLLNKDISSADAINSMILYLEEKNIIDIGEGNNIVIKNDNKIKKHEKFFIDKMEFIFSDLYHKTKTKYKNDNTLIEHLNMLIYEDMIDEGLIETKEKRSTLINYIKHEKREEIEDVMPLFYDIVAIVILGICAGNVNINFFTSIIFIVTVFISWCINLIRIFLNLQFESLKTKKGHESTMKMKAQKKFLKEYSLIAEKTIEDKKIWGYYIRSALLLDLKGKLDDESVKFYKGVLEKYNYIGLENKSKDLLFTIILTSILILPWIVLGIVSIKSIGVIFSTIISAFIFVPFVYGWFINKARTL